MKFPLMFFGLMIGLFANAQSVPSSAPAPASAPASVSAPTEKVSGSSPTAPPANGPLEFTEVVQVEGASAAELYNRGKIWFTKTFADSNHVLEVQDKEAGLLVGKGVITYEPVVLIASDGIRGHIGFTVKIMVKDGRYKFSIADFNHKGTPSHGYGPIDFGTITNENSAPVIKGTLEGLQCEKQAGACNKDWSQMKELAKETLAALIKTLKASMALPSKGADNW